MCNSPSLSLLDVPEAAPVRESARERESARARAKESERGERE